MSEERTFKVGDKVRIVKPDNVHTGDYLFSKIDLCMSNSWVGEMNGYVDRVGVVDSVGQGGYHLKGFRYVYLPEWLELVVRAEEPYAPGTKVEVVRSPTGSMPCPGSGVGFIRTVESIPLEGKAYHYYTVEDDYLYYGPWLKPINQQEEGSMNEHLVSFNEGDIIHLKQDIEVDGTPFSEDETLTVVAVHDVDIGHVVFQDEDGRVGITSLDNVKEGVGPSMDEPYVFEDVVEFKGCFDLDDEGDTITINTTSDFDEAYSLVTGKKYKVSVRIEEKE